jgi:membrane dipeptidase
MMNRREFLTCSLLLGGTAAAAPLINRGRIRLPGRAHSEYPRRVVDLVEESIVIDMLGLVTMDWAKLGRWEREPDAFKPGDFHKLKSSGITVFHPAVELGAADAFAATWHWIDGWNKFLDRYPKEFVRIDQASDLERSKAEGKIGIIQGMQNSDHFRTVADVRLFYDMGQRVSQLTYNAKNQIGDGCGVTRDCGLTGFGAEVVAEMNRKGMAIDVSHTGDRTSLDAFSASKKPVLITHSNCRALNPRHPRCKPDDVIRQMAARGGVMGITAIRSFVCARGPATIEDELDHFDYVAKIAGIEHLGVGSDDGLDGRDRGHKSIKMDVGGLDQPLRMFDLTEGLVRRGYSNRDIRLILGGNFQRVLGEIWAA